MKTTLSVVAIMLTALAALNLSCSHRPTKVVLPSPEPVVYTAAYNAGILQAEKAVMFVRVNFTYTWNGWEYNLGGWGSAFVVGNKQIVTCKHVAQPEKFDYDYNLRTISGDITKVSKKMYLWTKGQEYKLPDGNLNLGVALKLGKDFIIKASLPDVLRQHTVTRDGKDAHFYTHTISVCDVALLETKAALSIKPLKLGSITDADKGKKIILIGYPKGPRCMDTSVVNPSVSVGYIRKVEIYLRFNSPITGGNSGGCAITEDGTVVGIVSFMASEVIGYAIKAEFIQQLL